MVEIYVPQSILEYINVRTFVLISDALSIVGIGLAVFFFLRAKQRMQISYQLKETMIVGTPNAAFTGNLQVRFQEVDVPRVTATQIALWNSGNVTIRRADVAAGDPLALVLPKETRILQTALHRQNRLVNGVTLPERSPTSLAVIEFDFLDPGDGFSLNVIHTAEANCIGLTGTVIGLRDGFLRVDDQKYSYFEITKELVIPIILFPTLLLDLAFDPYAIHPIISRRLHDNIIITIFLVLCFYFIIMVSFSLKILSRTRKSKNLF